MSFREHTHPPGHDPAQWHCAVCKAEELEVDLSEDPAPEPVAGVQKPEFLQRFALVRFGPLVLGAQLWLAWVMAVLRRLLVVR